MTNAEIKTKSVQEIKKLLFLTAFGCTGALAKQANDKVEPYVLKHLK